jgi:hypothetical protein
MRVRYSALLRGVGYLLPEYWLKYAAQKTGSKRRISRLLEAAIKARISAANDFSWTILTLLPSERWT